MIQPPLARIRPFLPLPARSWRVISVMAWVWERESVVSVRRLVGNVVWKEAGERTLGGTYVQGVVVAGAAEGCQAAEERDGFVVLEDREAEMATREFGDDGETSAEANCVSRNTVEAKNDWTDE